MLRIAIKVRKRRRKKRVHSIGLDDIAEAEGKALILAFKVKKPLSKRMTLNRKLMARGDGILDKRAAKRHLLKPTEPKVLWVKCVSCKNEFDGVIVKAKRSFEYDKRGDRCIVCPICFTTYWHMNAGHKLNGHEVEGWRSAQGTLILMSKISNWRK